MEGGFQKSLQLFVANGYCEFEDDIRVDLPNVLDGKPDYANSPCPEFFARARCVTACAAVPNLNQRPMWSSLFFLNHFE